MYNQKDNNKRTIVRNVCVSTAIAIVSLALAFFSMEAIKNIPGNNFKTEIEFVATALLVFTLWFLSIGACVWLISFLINSHRFKKNPSDEKAKAVIVKGKRDSKRLAKVGKWALIAVVVYWVVMFLGGAIFWLIYGLSMSK